MTRGPAKQFDRDEVLERALQIFWARGYEATGMADLLEHMQIGRQSLYDTFGDKRSLFREALDRYIRTRISKIVGIMRAPGSPVGNLKKVFEQWKQMGADNEHWGCLVGNSIGELANRDPEMGEILAGYMDIMENEFVALLKRAEQAGEIDPPLPLRDLARTMVTTIQGLALLTKIDPASKRAPSVFRSTMTLIGAG